MADVLFVSKPIAPPWNDSSKNLARDVAWGMHRHTPIVMGLKGGRLHPPHGRSEAVYPNRSHHFGHGFSPAVRDQWHVLARLVGGRSVDLFHFFFAPNLKSSFVGAGCRKLRRTPCVHTVCSAPAPNVNVHHILFADATVVLSRHTETRLLEAGVPADRLHRIPPGIEALTPVDVQTRHRLREQFGLPVEAPVVVYPGDLEFGTGASRMVDALHTLPNAHLVMACRQKTPRAKTVERQLRMRCERRQQRLTWIGETPRIHELLAIADVVALPTETLYAKMDIPLVLLEAMSLGVPVIVAENTPVAELGKDGTVVVVGSRSEELRDAISNLLDHGHEQGARGRKAVLTTFTRERMAERYERLYDGLLR